MTFQAYPGYKDSEITWIGDVPISWEVKPFKWLLSNNDGGVWGDDPTGEGDTFVLRSTDQTVDGNWKLTDPAPRRLSAKEKASALLVEGDLVVTKSSGSSLHIGKTTLVTADIAKQGCCYGNFMQRLRVNSGFTPKLAWYVMNNELARAQLDLLSNSTTGLANLNGTLIGEILLPVSSVAEQTQIARFLDHETARIDALIEKQQRLIELLKEKRQAVISQAVTKGLDPTVPMKDSGVEWLDEVPAHWDVVSTNYRYEIQLGRMLNEQRAQGDHLKPYLRVFDVQWNAINTTDLPLMDFPPEVQPMYRLKRGDLMVNEGGSYVGRSAIWRAELDECYYQKALHRLRPRDVKSDTAEFFLHVMEMATQQGVFVAGGNQTTIDHLTAEQLRQYRFAFPPLEEQLQIAEKITAVVSKIQNTTSEAQQLIGYLQERRSALISAAVTGKIDVRGWQPPASASQQ